MASGQDLYGERMFSKDHPDEAPRLSAITQTYDPSSAAL